MASSGGGTEGGDGVGLPAEPAPINNFPLAECYRDSDGKPLGFIGYL